MESSKLSYFLVRQKVGKNLSGDSAKLDASVAKKDNLPPELLRKDPSGLFFVKQPEEAKPATFLQHLLRFVPHARNKPKYLTSQVFLIFAILIFLLEREFVLQYYIFLVVRI